MGRSTDQRDRAKLASKFSKSLIQHPSLGPAIRHALDSTSKWNQRQCPLTAPFVVLLVLLLSLERSLSIARVLHYGIKLLREKGRRISLKIVTREALCHARARLGFEPLKALFEHTAAIVRPRKTFHGLRVWALDTMDLRVPDSPANAAEFGRPGVAKGQAGFPQIGASVLLDVEGRRVRDVLFEDVTASERNLAVLLVRHLKRGDLVIQDRGLAALWVLDSYARHGVHHLTRIPKTWKPRILQRLGRGDYLVELRGVIPHPLRHDSDGVERPRFRKLVARLIEYHLPGKRRVRLVTSLIDHKRYTAREIAHRYHDRWDIEIAFDEIKTHLATVTHGTMHTVFRSKSPTGVLQEAYALFAAYNLIRQLISKAARRRGLNPLHISFVEALDFIRRTIETIALSRAAQRAALAILLEDVAECRIDRPRRPRLCPRVVKVKTSRYDKKLAHHVERPNLAYEQLTLVNRYQCKRKAA
jgi:hypothetical protein